MKLLFSRLIAVLILVFCATLAYSQTTAIVTGVVTDSLGAVMPGVTVVLSNPATGVSYTVKTDSAGSYRVPNVPPGPGYTIEFTSQGFSSSKVDGIYVNVANSTTENAKLSPGNAPVEVKVSATGQGVTLDTTDASIGNNFQVSQLNNLPVYDRSSPAVLFTLQPGITLSGATTGARVDQTNTTVDGLDVNDFATGTFASHHRKRPGRFSAGVSRHHSRLYRRQRPGWRRPVSTGHPKRNKPVARQCEFVSSRQLHNGQHLV